MDIQHRDFSIVDYEYLVLPSGTVSTWQVGKMVGSPGHTAIPMAADNEVSRSGSVLDLPQLYTKPSSTDLFAILDRLKVKPAAWGGEEEEEEEEKEEEAASRDDDTGLPRYLTGIIASPLAWIEDENIKDQIWEAASKRLSERSGRSGMSHSSMGSDYIDIDHVSNAFDVSNIRPPNYDNKLSLD